MRLGCETLLAFLTIGGYPPADGAVVDAENLGNMDLRVPFLNSLNGQPPPSLEFLSGASCSHGQLYAWPKLADK
jgi:hypothetical protein